MKDDQKAPLDGRGPGVNPITEPDSSLAGDMGAIGKLEEIVGALQGDEPEITAPDISSDKQKNTKKRTEHYLKGTQLIMALFQERACPILLQLMRYPVF